MTSSESIFGGSRKMVSDGPSSRGFAFRYVFPPPLALPSRFRTPFLRIPLWGLKSANPRFEAIRANCSNVVQIGIFLRIDCPDSRFANRPPHLSCCLSAERSVGSAVEVNFPGHLQWEQASIRAGSETWVQAGSFSREVWAWVGGGLKILSNWRPSRLALHQPFFRF